MGSHWTLLSVVLLTAVRSAVNRSWRSTNLVVLGWDRPRHLIESLAYNDMLKQASFDSLLRTLKRSGQDPLPSTSVSRPSTICSGTGINQVVNRPHKWRRELPGVQPRDVTSS